MSLTGKKAPYFIGTAVINGEEIVENFSLSQYIDKKNVILFFYSKDFSFVCPTEIHAFQEKLADFEKRNTVVIGCSTDTEETHLAWLNTPRGSGGIEGVTFPIIADTAKTISMNFGVLGGEYILNNDTRKWTFIGKPIAKRGAFIIDKKGIVRHESVNDFALGRNIDEYLRLIDAQLHVEKYGEVCPANWEEGKEAVEASSEGVSEYFSIN
ncbi:MAG: peroxiredoxin [Ferruginibacter sp.]